MESIELDNLSNNDDDDDEFLFVDLLEYNPNDTYITQENDTYINDNNLQEYNLLQEELYGLHVYNIQNDYSNKKFCFYCIYYSDIYKHDYKELLERYYYQHKYSKILLLLFRLFPSLFKNIDYSQHKILSNVQSMSNTMEIINNKNEYRYHIYDIFFHQTNLYFEDYTKCDICGICACPLHEKICLFLYMKCFICKEKIWCLCSKCKVLYNPGYICSKYHKNNL